MAYITIDQDGYAPAAVYVIDTEEGEQKARNALREAGLEFAPVYAGEPDGTGDSYATGAKLFAR